jgi:hypothetical protein
MAGRLIRGTTRSACWKHLEEQVRGFWGRLAQAGSDRGVIAVTPSFELNEPRTAGEIALGGAFVRDHVPMATSAEVEALFERSRRHGVLLGEPPVALVLGIQKLAIDEEKGLGFALRTTWYKYCLLVRDLAAADTGAPPWFALRLESDGRIGWNSWLLNHPVHHFQLGLCENLRMPSPNGRSLVSFVDAALRSFTADVWSEMYPSLHLHLSDASGRFAAFTQRSAGVDAEIRAAHADDLREALRQGRADGMDWHEELEQWRDDVDDRSECAPELFDVLVEG